MNLPAAIATASLVFASTLVTVTYAPDASANSVAHWPVPATKTTKLNPVSATSDSTDEGEHIYKERCTGCHGPITIVGSQPRDLSSDRVQRQSDGALFWKIRQGKRDMPGFKHQLNRRQVWHVINYMRSSEFSQ